MTRDEIMMLDMEAVQARGAEIAADLKAIEERNLEADALEERKLEMDALEERKKAIEAEAIEKRAKMLEVVAEAKVIEEPKKESNKMTFDEIRNSKEYIDAYAEYLKSGDDKECRALLSENYSGSGDPGTVAVPVFVEERIHTAWENNEIMRRVTRTFFPGNLKVGVEISSSPAVFHAEGSGAVDEEELTLEIVTLVPVMIKKWISITDEVLNLRGRAFIDYIYDELEYRIVQLAASSVITVISNSTSAGFNSSITTNSYLTAVIEGIAELSDEATDLAVIVNRATWAKIKGAAVGANYAYDPFEGLPVLFNESVADDIVMVGDLKGVTANFPNGDEVKFIFDDRTLMTSDLVRVLGKLYIAIAATATERFAVVTVSPSEGSGE